MGYKKLIRKRTTVQTQEEMNVLVFKELVRIERNDVVDVYVLQGMEIEPIEPIQDYIIKNIQELDDYVQSVTEEKKDWKALNQFLLEELSRD